MAIAAPASTAGWMMQDLGLDTPWPDLHTVIQAWVQARSGSMGMPAMDPSAAESEPVGREMVPTPATPTPKPVDPCGAPAVHLYWETIIEHLDDLDQAARTIGTQLYRMGQNPAMLFNEDWVMTKGAWLGVLMFLHEELTGKTAPPVLQAGHAHLLDTSSRCDQDRTRRH